MADVGVSAGTAAAGPAGGGSAWSLAGGSAGRDAAAARLALLGGALLGAGGLPGAHRAALCRAGAKGRCRAVRATLQGSAGAGLAAGAASTSGRLSRECRPA